jgi:hypothetical protein
MPAAVTVGGLVINVSADTGQLKTDMAEGSRVVDAGAKSMINSLTGVTESSDRVTDAGARMIKQLKDEIATFGMTSQELARQKASLAGVGAEYDALTQRLNAMRGAQASFSQDVASTSTALRTHGAAASEAGGHVEEFGFKTASSKRELLVLAHELSQGNFKKFGGSMLVLAEQTGAAGMLFSAAGLSAIALGAAVVGVGVALAKGAEQQHEMNAALVLTGNYAGLTSDSLNDLAHAAVAAGGSIGEAKKAATALAGSGKFTGDQIGMITAAAVEMEHATGQSVEKTIEQFESLAVQTTGHSARSSDAISKATVKLDDQYHFLTLSVYDHIRALEREGDVRGASAAATEAFAHATKDRAEEIVGSLGYVARAWNGIKEAIGGAGDAIGDWGKKSTAASEVARLQALADAKNPRTGAYVVQDDPSTGRGGAKLGMDRTKLLADLAAAQTNLTAANAKAAAQAKETLAQSEAVHAAQRVDIMLLGAQRKSQDETTIALSEYHAEQAKIRAVNANDPRVTEQATAAGDAAIRKAHATATKGNDDRAATLQDALTNAQSGLEREKSIYDARDKMLDLYHTKFGMADADFYAGREAARAEYVASEAITFAKESALLKASEAQARNPQEVAAAKGKYDQLVAAHNKFVDDMRNAGGQDSAGADASAQKQYDDIVKATHDAGVASITSLDDQIAKQKEHNAEIGKTKEQIELAKQAQVDLATTQLQSDADYLRDGLAKWGLDEKSQAAIQIRLTDLDTEIAKRRTIAGLLSDGADAEAGAKAAADLDKYLDPTKAQAFGNSLKGAFGGAADSLSKLTDVLTKYGTQQAANEKARQEAEVARKTGVKTQAEYLDEINDIEARNTKQQLGSYGDMASAASGFFDKSSNGYKALQTASEVMHAAQLAMNLASIAPAMAAGAAQFFAQSGWGGFAGVAAMAAVVAGFGVAVSGGGSDTTAKDRQAAQGSGTVLGDSSAKSDSLKKSIDLTAANSSTQINYLSGLLMTLKGIQTDINSFASQLVQSTDISNPGMHLNTNNGLASTVGTAGLAAGGAALGGMAGAGLTAFTAAGAVGGPIGMVVGAVAGAILSKIPAVGKLMTSIFGGKQSVEDSGFTLGKTTVGTALDSGVNGLSYADIKTSGGWFSKDHTDTKDTALGADANQQFTQIISSIADSITQAGALVGVSGDDFTKQLNSFVIDIGKVSLKGMTGDEIEKTLESVFSKLGDQMAQAAIPDLTEFQQVGEGYLETLVRVSSDYAKVDASLTSIGKTFGSVGVASIGAREDLISMMGGIDDFQSKTADFDSNFLTKAQQLAPVAAYVTTTLQGMNLGWVQTREQLAGVVGGLNLTSQSGRDTYAALMNLESAFAATHAAIVDTTMSEQDIADQRKDLQDKVDGLLMTSEQLRAKELLTIDATNVALYNQAAAAQTAKDALDLQAQIYEATGDKAGAAAVLLAQHQAALAQTDPALRTLTQQLWDVQSAATAAGTAKSDASALLSNVDAAYSTLDTVIQREKDALQKRIDTENDVVTKLTSLGSSIKSALSSFDVTDDPAADRKAAQATLGSSLALMQSGAILSDDQATALQDALTTATKDSKGQFSSSEDYMFDMLKTQRQIAQLGDVTKDQETTEQKQLDQMKAQSTAFDDQLAAAKQQVDLLKGIDTSTTTLAQAMSALQLSLAGAKANPLVSATPAITQAYQDSLGRAPDATGLAYWQNQVAGGTSTADVVSSIKTSKEAQSQIEKLYQTLLGRPADASGLDFFLHSGASLDDVGAAIKSSSEYKAKIPGFALGGDFGGGLRIVGENGPELEATGPARIFNAQQTSGMLSRMGSPSGDNTVLFTAALAKMQQTLERVSAETRSGAMHSAKTANLLKRAIPNDSMKVSGVVTVAPATA